MYRIKLQFITAPIIIDSAYLTKLVAGCNDVLKANSVIFSFVFNPATDYRQVPDAIYATDDGSLAKLDPNGFGAGVSEGEKARFRLAMEYPDKLVIFAHQGVGGNSGGHSWFEMENHVMYFLDLDNSFNGQVGGLLHEIGHHLHLFHTFSGNYIDLTEDEQKKLTQDLLKEQKTLTYNIYFDALKNKLASLIRGYVKKGHSIQNGLQVFDNDEVSDTAPDPGNAIINIANAVHSGLGDANVSDMQKHIQEGKLDPCGGLSSVSIPVEFLAGIGKIYTLKIDKTNIMSYYQSCDNQKSVSLGQQARMLKSLTVENRNNLLHTCGVKWPTGKIYFFKGPQYVRCSPGVHTVDLGYPRLIKKNWKNWPADWLTPDAALVWPGDKQATFFQGMQYVTYETDQKAIIAGPASVTNLFPNWPADWTGLDAALVVGKVAYLFRGMEYIVYSFVEGKLDGGPKPISQKFNFFWTSDFDCIIPATDTQVYVFKGNKFIISDLSIKQLITPTPIPVRGNWPGISSTFTSAFVGWDGRFNFCKGKMYSQFDPIVQDTADTLQSIHTNWKLPASWSSFDAELVWTTGLDASNNPTARLVYFFHNDEFILFDVLTKRSLMEDKPVKITQHFDNWPKLLPPKIFATLKWPDGKAFLFVRGLDSILYMVYDTITDQLDPTLLSVHSFFKPWPSNYKSHWKYQLKAVLANWWEGSQGVIYFFSDDEYLKYDVVAKSVLPDYPKPIEGSLWRMIDWRLDTAFDNLS